MVNFASFPVQEATSIAEKPVQSPLEALTAGVGTGFQTAGQVQQFMQRRQALASEQQQQQMRQLQLQAEPQMIENQLRSQAHSLAAQRLLQDKNIHGYVMSRLAELKGTPPDQLAQGWGNFRQHLIDSGAPPEDIPKQYNQNAQNAIDRAHALATQPFQQKLMLEEMKGRTAVETAAAKAQIKAQIQTGAQPDVEAKAFAQNEGKKNSDYFDTVNTTAANSNTVFDDTLQLEGLGKEAAAQFGAVRGGTMALSQKGQKVRAATSKLVIDLFNTMPHVGRGGSIFINTLLRAKPGEKMSYAAFKNIVAGYKVIAQRGIEKNNFATYLKQIGITDRNRIESVWGKYNQTYKMFNDEGIAQTQNMGQWAKFLADNAHLTSASMAHQQTAKIPIPQGFRFPEGGSPTLIPNPYSTV